ncbi:putative porin [Methylotenera sp.]|uniref:putative porin n=1 Tax=Methylotenera sp. TaxID=2051956 RepID=UPI00248871DF|nr:putative porin [Methylotenera sp.]MDI1362056.1 putative porin [Methylotenera sp.]
MNFKLRNMVAATLAGSVLMGFGTSAMADSTFDLVQALVAKGVLTEEEALPLLKGRENDIQVADKKVKKAAKLGMADAIDNATLYGDIRVRYEDRQGTGATTGADVDETRERARYKLTLGVKTESGDWYTDLALAMGANGRSDNATFGKSATTNINDKETVFVKRAMVGYKATDWLAIEAGRMNNPLYTTPMVWDADLNFEGLAEKVNYKMNFADLFFTAAQAQYQGDRKDFSTTGDTITTELFAFQGGGRYLFNDTTSAKAALTYTKYSHNTSNTSFKPGTGTDGAGAATVPGTVNAAGTAFVPAVAAKPGYAIAASGVNDLDTIEIPAEVNFMANSSIGVRLFGDYVYNTNADDRAKHSGLAAAANGSDGSDDTAWMLGVAVGSANDFKSFEANKMVKGDWSARIWYQDVGVWSVDPNAVDSDFMDSRVNMKGTILKTQYNFTDNVYANFAYGHATRKNNTYGAAGAAQDLALNLKDFDLVQLDLTYKF